MPGSIMHLVPTLTQSLQGFPSHLSLTLRHMLQAVRIWLGDFILVGGRQGKSNKNLELPSPHRGGSKDGSSFS